jgi:hypothetical protein
MVKRLERRAVYRQRQDTGTGDPALPGSPSRREGHRRGHCPVVAPARVARASAARARPTGGVLVALPGAHSRNPPAGGAAILPAPSSATRGDHQVPRRGITTGSPRQGTDAASAAMCAPDAQVRLPLGRLFAQGNVSRADDFSCTTHGERQTLDEVSRSDVG